MDAKNILYNIFYIPIMKRWGNDEGHHYILGVFDNIEQARKVALDERENRAHKYEFVIYGIPLNKLREDWPKGIHRVAVSEGMAALSDGEQDWVLSKQEYFKIHYERTENSRLRSREEELLLELEQVRRAMK